MDGRLLPGGGFGPPSSTSSVPSGAASSEGGTSFVDALNLTEQQQQRFRQYLLSNSGSIGLGSAPSSSTTASTAMVFAPRPSASTLALPLSARAGSAMQYDAVQQGMSFQYPNAALPSTTHAMMPTRTSASSFIGDDSQLHLLQQGMQAPQIPYPSAALLGMGHFTTAPQPGMGQPMPQLIAQHGLYPAGSIVAPPGPEKETKKPSGGWLGRFFGWGGGSRGDDAAKPAVPSTHTMPQLYRPGSMPLGGPPVLTQQYHMPTQQCKPPAVSPQIAARVASIKKYYPVAGLLDESTIQDLAKIDDDLTRTTAIYARITKAENAMNTQHSPSMNSFVNSGTNGTPSPSSHSPVPASLPAGGGTPGASNKRNVTPASRSSNDKGADSSTPATGGGSDYRSSSPVGRGDLFQQMLALTGSPTVGQFHFDILDWVSYLIFGESYQYMYSI